MKLSIVAKVDGKGNTPVNLAGNDESILHGKLPVRKLYNNHEQVHRLQMIATPKFVHLILYEISLGILSVAVTKYIKSLQICAFADLM